ncbi:MAG TPA: DUF4148 domain-containing protein [Paraburkholderia sp.]|nr:DUF4148 domain-containing protein [Paraburkholderia sp.]
MKIVFAIAAFACCASSAFAQSNATNPTATLAAAAPSGSYGTASTPQVGGWVPPYGQPVVEKTRAQVYQELVEAEKDGQLAYLNSTLYAH